MGLTKVTTLVTDLNGRMPGYEALFTVDGASIHCIAPASVLQAAGIVPRWKMVYKMDNGTLSEVEYGFAIVNFLGNETVVHIIFGAEGTEPILGIMALENVGIGIEPATSSLKRMPAVSLKRLQLV